MKFIPIFIFLPIAFLHAQSYYAENKESFNHIKDKTFRKELASFTIVAELEESVTEFKLNEIPVYNFGNSYAIFKKDSISVTIKTGVFNKSQHKYEYYNNKHVIKIDGKSFWGTDGECPKTTIQSVQCIMGKDTIHIPVSARNDLYNPNLCWQEEKEIGCHTRILISNNKRRVYIYMLNGDGAGGYEVTWIIQDKKYLRRVVDHGF